MVGTRRSARADQRRRINEIRAEELDHRARVGRMLAALDARPSAFLEVWNRCLGTAIAAFCQVGGQFLPMYGAGWIERRNIVEYEVAARLAFLCGAEGCIDELLEMAEVEWEHERYFREQAAAHPLSHVLHVGPAPGPKSALRANFAQFAIGVDASARPAPLAAAGRARLRRYVTTI